MRLPEEYDDEPKMNSTVVYTIFGATFAVVAILVLVLVMNHQKTPNGHKEQPISSGEVSTQTGADDSFALGDSTLSPDDLDFWDMYPQESQSQEKIEESETEEVVSDPATDGKHTKITNKDGEEEWVVISPYLAKHEYDFTKMVSQSDLMKYYVDGKKVSYVGVDISKYQAYIDFVKVKKAGIDYVMIRVGARGYSTGQIMIDDYFLDNIKRASDAGLQIGVYFYSQATSKAEAEEEANVVLEYIKDYDITYPIAFVMEDVDNDKARIDDLSKDDKTKIAKAFLNKVEKAGYIPLLYGDKEWLIKQLDLSKLTDFDVWLSQPGDLPDYPYKFTMWQYSTTASIDGISGQSNLNISFIDYSVK